MAEEEGRLGRDDYSLSRVPQKERYSWVSVAVQRFGQLSALSQFLLGATLGFGLDFWTAFWAITLGSVVLEIVSIFTGIMGQREGLSTSLLARWAGFGKYGSALIGLVIATSLIGWFGIQNAVMAEGLHSLLGGVPLWVWTVISGAAVTLIVVYGFLSMTWTAYITVPAFILLAGYSIAVVLGDHSLSSLITSPPPGTPMTLAIGATAVAGGFMVGAVITPDMSRFNRSVGDVIKQTIVGITLGEYLIGLIGVLLAHAIETEDVVQIIISTSGTVGVLILVTATLKINDWNLYSGSLGLVNLLDSTFGVRINRAWITLLVGALGTALAAAGILSKFVGFLTLLGVTIPPIAGIMVTDYFILRRHRQALEESARQGTIPAEVEPINWVALVAWLLASYTGYALNWGIPVINALLAAGILYYLGMKLFGKAAPLRGGSEQRA
ncbi:MAG: cytosine permease [Bacillota bacterium]|nr:cytosine permease [Bacillota bacterium]